MNISKIIARHLLRRTTDEEEARLDEWRKESEANEHAFVRLTDPSRLQSEWVCREAIDPMRAARQMKERIGREQPLWLRPAVWRNVAAAVALAVCSGVAGYLLNGGDAVAEDEGTETLLVHHSAKPCELKIGDECALSVPRGGEFKVELEDGTEVWLNAQSRLEYPETFGDAERRVRLEGEAYFKVAKNAKKPFFVEAGDQIIRVVGTEFNVRSYPEDATVQTTLVSGKITMSLKGSEDREMVLTPGSEAVFDKEERSLKVKSVDTEVMTSWKDGMFVFEDQRLDDIMVTLSRWYDFDYEFLDQKAAATVFMGRIPRYSNFDDVMQIIEMSGGLKLSLKNRKLTISSTK